MTTMIPVVPVAANPPDQTEIDLHYYLLRGLMEYGVRHGVKSFPPSHSRLWDQLLYDLKQMYPIEFSNSAFDRNGGAPRSVEFEIAMDSIAEFLCVEDGSYRIWLVTRPIESKKSFLSKPPNFDKIVASAFEIASGIEGFLK